MPLQVFSNSNAENWLSWLFRKKDQFHSITFYFLSQINATSPRFFPLYEQTKNLRIVVFRGLRMPKTDRAILWFVNLFVLLFAKKINRYRYFVDHGFKYTKRLKTNLIIQLDDPTFKDEEIYRLRKLGENNSKHKEVRIVVTSEQIRGRLIDSGVTSPIKVIGQGYTESLANSEIAKFTKFSMVYSSNYIHYKKDKHDSHPNWGVSEFIDTLMPSILSELSEVEIHMVGELGPNAKRVLTKYDRVITHGRVDTLTNADILRRCHIGLYPRKHDNGWRVQKIYDYLGARLPIIAFKLEDTRLVSELGIGILVNTNKEFIEAIKLLVNDKNRYREIVGVASSVRAKYNWTAIAEQFDGLLLAEK